MKIILRLLKCFKFARRKLGGKWHYVEAADSAGGITGPIRYWTQKVDDDTEVIKEENHYPVLKK